MSEDEKLSDKLRLWADADVMETARDGTFQYNDAVKWAALMEEAAAAIEALEAENFALAAQVCHDPIAGEHGDMVCGRIATATARAAEDERDRLLDEAINMVCSSREDVRTQGKHAIDFLRYKGAMPASERGVVRNAQRPSEIGLRQRQGGSE